MSCGSIIFSISLTLTHSRYTHTHPNTRTHMQDLRRGSAQSKTQESYSAKQWGPKSNALGHISKEVVGMGALTREGRYSCDSYYSCKKRSCIDACLQRLYCLEGQDGRGLKDSGSPWEESGIMVVPAGMNLLLVTQETSPGTPRSTENHLSRRGHETHKW